MKLKRKMYQTLIEWKKENGKTALLIEGARRVGKTTLTTDFAKNEYKSFILIDFSVASSEIKSLFTDYASELDNFFFFLSTLTNTTLYERNTLIILDEVQLFPKARQLIKQLVKDRRYDYIETGSLLSIKQNVKEILIPSEERSLTLNPLDFEEFCMAINEDKLFSAIKDRFNQLKPMGPLHTKALRVFRQYILIGGMPQAVLEFIQTNDYTKVDQIKRDILRLYRSDIAKYASGYESKVLQIFDEIPSQLSKHEKKFTLASLSKNARFRDYEDAFMWLDEARITNSCYNASDPQLGLGLYKDRLTLKMYMADTGLLISQAYNSSPFMHQEIAENIVLDQLDVNHGMVFENIVAQSLVATNKKLYFYSRQDKEQRENHLEIDFLIVDPFNPKKISPIEVKSSKRYKTSSLTKFKSKFKSRIGQSILLHTKDLIKKEDIIYMPIYMVGLF